MGYRGKFWRYIAAVVAKKQSCRHMGTFTSVRRLPSIVPTKLLWLRVSSEYHSSILKYFCRRVVSVVTVSWGKSHLKGPLHLIAEVVHHFLDPCLHDLHSAGKTWTSAILFSNISKQNLWADVLQYRVAPPTRSRPASSNAFSSACKQRQLA